MSAALDPLRHVYNVEPSGPLAGPAVAEAEGLRGVRDLLDRRPSPAPDVAVVGRVLARAAEAARLDAAADLLGSAQSSTEAAVIAQSMDALDRLPRALPAAHVIAAVESFAVQAVSVSEDVPARSAVEAAVIAQSQEVLDRMPRLRPSAETIAAVEAAAARAAEETVPAESPVEEAIVAQSQDLLSRMPRVRPEASAIAAIEARAAEPGLGDAADLFGSARTPIEAEVMAQSMEVLDRLPQQRPDPSVVAAVEARAAGASGSLEAVRAVYADGPAVDTVEAETLRQSRQIIERAVAVRPRLRPEATAVEAVLARAAEASGLAADSLPADSPIESAVVAQSLAALDRLPRPRPEAATLDAVRLAAATATGAASGTSARPARPASVDRAAIQDASQGGSRRRGFPAVWAGASALVMAAVAAFFLLPAGGPVEETTEAVALADAAPAPSLVADAETADEPEPEEEAPPAAPAGGSALVAAAGVSSVVPIPESVRPATPRPAPTGTPTVAPSALAAEPVRATRAASTAPRPDPAPAWDAGDDVRALSLRMQELDNVTWDSPAEAFGVPTTTATGTAGVQAVRAGAPARARLRSAPDSTQR